MGDQEPFFPDIDGIEAPFLSPEDLGWIPDHIAKNPGALRLYCASRSRAWDIDRETRKREDERRNNPGWRARERWPGPYQRINGQWTGCPPERGKQLMPAHAIDRMTMYLDELYGAACLKEGSLSLTQRNGEIRDLLHACIEETWRRNPKFLRELAEKEVQKP